MFHWAGLYQDNQCCAREAQFSLRKKGAVGSQDNERKHSNSGFRSNMDGPRNYHIKRRKSDRERQILYSTTYMWNLKNDTNEHIYKTEIESQM